MWSRYILTILLCVGCASQKPVARDIASEPLVVAGPVDYKKSRVQIFPAVADTQGIWYYFFIQLRDAAGNYVDCDPSKIVLKTSRGEGIDFKFEKIKTGRYYLTLEKTAQISSNQIDFFVEDKILRTQIKLSQRLPDGSASNIKILSNENNVINFELRLADKMNQPVDTLDQPDIILDGQGTVENFKHISPGVWQFSVVYPEDNQIMYFSVRSQGVYLSKILRYQHVEK